MSDQNEILVLGGPAHGTLVPQQPTLRVDGRDSESAMAYEARAIAVGARQLAFFVPQGVSDEELAGFVLDALVGLAKRRSFTPNEVQALSVLAEEAQESADEEEDPLWASRRRRSRNEAFWETLVAKLNVWRAEFETAAKSDAHRS